MAVHTGRLAGSAPDPSLLTRRELDVVRLIAEGLSCREAAHRLSRSPRTVENHLRSVYQKLRVRNRVELVRVAEERGLLRGIAKPDAALLPVAAIELKSRALEIIQQIDHRLAQRENHHYFGELVLALADAFGTRWAGITEITSHDDLLDVIAIADDGKPVEFLQCPLGETPCDIAIAEGECVVWEGLARRFPRDPAIQHFGSTCYVGLRLDDRLVGPVGVLWIMDDKPINRDLLPLEVLRVISRRAAAELALAKALDLHDPPRRAEPTEALDLD